ncbi:hypothetical protein V2J09_014335 [Rumex salicifolius]
MAVSHPHLKPLNSKISNYMRTGLVEEAHQLFDEMPQRDTITWNAMIRGYFQNGWSEKALNLFSQMPSRDIYSYNTVIGGLMRCGNVKGANDVFEAMPFRNVVTWNAMISGYIHNSMLDDAVSVFDTMPIKDIFSWNLVIGGLVNSGELSLARKLFDDMGPRDVVSWTIMISGLMNAGFVAEARCLFDQMPEKDTRAWHKIIEGYVRNDDFKSAELLLRETPEQDMYLWRILITGLVNDERISDAMRLFFDMPNKCQKLLDMILLRLIDNGLVKPAHAILEKTTPFTDLVSSTNLIVGYFRASEVDTATKIFQEMPIRDTAAWNAMIFGLGENKRGADGLKLFIKMKEPSCENPNESTFTSVLKICSELPSLDLGVQIHAHVIETGFNNITSVCNALLTMYSRCGDMDSALTEFRSMPSHDLISWNSLICGYAHHGDGEKALKFFEKMAVTNLKPDCITFVGVLSACCHSGLVNKGKHNFNLMRKEYLIQPTQEHYTCIVNMMGRNGLLEEAVEFLDQMREEGVEIPASVWGALLDACRMHKNVAIGEVAGKNVLESEPWNSSVYLILAEMYMNHGKVDEAERILDQMKVKGMVKKQPGCSWI